MNFLSKVFIIIKLIVWHKVTKYKNIDCRVTFPEYQLDMGVERVLKTLIHGSDGPDVIIGKAEAMMVMMAREQ